MLNNQKYNEIIKNNMDVNIPYSYLDNHKDRFIYINNYINRLYENNRTNVRILDYGSHTGIMGVLLSNLGFNVECCDLKEVIDKYEVNYSSNEIQHEFIRGDESLPYEDEYFDLVIFTEILEHLHESPIEKLNDIKRIIKPNGYLLLTTPNVMNLENKVKFFFNINIYQDIYRYCYNPRYSLHYREYTKKDLTKLLKEFLKFDKLKFQYFNYAGGRNFVSKMIQKVSFIISTLIPSLRYCILVLAKK